MASSLDGLVKNLTSDQCPNTQRFFGDDAAEGSLSIRIHGFTQSTEGKATSIPNWMKAIYPMMIMHRKSGRNSVAEKYGTTTISTCNPMLCSKFTVNDRNNWLDWYNAFFRVNYTLEATANGAAVAADTRPVPIVLGNFWRLEQLFAVLATSSKFPLSEQFFEQNIGLEHISSTKKPTISWKTSTRANFSLRKMLEPSTSCKGGQRNLADLTRYQRDKTRLHFYPTDPKDNRNPYFFDTFNIDGDNTAKLSTCRLQYHGSHGPGKLLENDFVFENSLNFSCSAWILWESPWTLQTTAK